MCKGPEVGYAWQIKKWQGSIAYSEQCWIRDLGRRKFCFGAKRCGFSHSEFCAAKVLLKVERDKASDIDIRRGQRVPHL